MIIRTRTEVTTTLWEDWAVEPIPDEHRAELKRNHLALFDYATTHGGQGWSGSPTMPVRVAMELDGEETRTIEDAFILTNPGNPLEAWPLDYVNRADLIEWIETLPEGGANKSRDAGRGYSQAINDVLAKLKTQ